MEDIPKDWCIESIDEKTVPKRIDSYYSQILGLKTDLGEEKYPELNRLLKVILVLPHGNADVERGFSQTTNFLTESRTRLCQASIGAIQTTKDGLKQYDYKYHLVPITKEFINKGVSSICT